MKTRHPLRIKKVVCILILSLIITPGFAQETDKIVFKKINEPKENAFSLLIPENWLIDGGIFRIDPTQQGGAAQSIAAKCDFAAKSDRKGSNMIRWLPDMLYFDMRGAPAAAMFPQGSNYNGMTVLNKMYPADFIQFVVIPYAHPNIQSPQILSRKELPDLAKIYANYARGLSPMLTMTYYAEIVELSYIEDGITYREKILCVIEDYGQLGAGLWGNKQTFLIRTPANKYEKMAPIFSVIQNSVEFNEQWIIGEVKGQMTRNEIMSNTLKTIQDIDNQIVTHQQKTNAEIHHDMFLVLNDKEEYINPYTQKVETGSNQWKHRWVNDLGNVIYTDIDDYNPNHDPGNNYTSFKKTPIRRR